MDNQFIILYILLIFIFWTLFVSPYLVSSTRQKLFTIRDNIFLDFIHDEEYQRLRDEINLFIRFADKASWQRMLFDFVFLHKQLKTIKTDSISFENTEFNKYFLLCTILIARLIVLRSPTMMIFLVPIIFFAIIRVEILQKFKNKASSFVIKDASIYA